MEDLTPNSQIICERICVQKPSIGVHSEFVQEKPGVCAQCGDAVEALEPSRCYYCLAIICWTCWDATMGACHGCVADLARNQRKIKAELQAMHKSKVGRPKTLKDCVHCGNRFGARVFRQHKPICAKLTPTERAG